MTRREELLAALVEYHSGDEDYAREALEDNYCGAHNSLADYVREQLDEDGDIPDYLRNYIDYAKVGRDWELSGAIYTIELGRSVQVFNNH